MIVASEIAESIFLLQKLTNLDNDIKRNKPLKHIVYSMTSYLDFDQVYNVVWEEKFNLWYLTNRKFS